MEYYFMCIILISYIISKKWKRLYFFGILLSIGALHLFGFLSLMVVAIIEIEPFKGLLIIATATAFLTLASIRPAINSKLWLWDKK